MFDKLAEKLDATKTEFFSHQGEVVSSREVVDHSTQMKAIEQIAKISGANARENDNKPRTPSVKLVMKDGVMTLVVGEDSEPELEVIDGSPETETEVLDDPSAIIENMVASAPPAASVDCPQSQAPLMLPPGVINDELYLRLAEAESDFETVKVRRGERMAIPSEE